MKNNIILFLKFIFIFFTGLTLTNIIAIAIKCILSDFDLFFTQIKDLPYILYLILAIVLSVVITIILECGKKH